MKESKEILAVGSIAFDTINTSNGSREKLLGGSSTYFGIAASHYTQTSLIGVVGNDFTDNEWKLFKKHNINTESVEVISGDTFSWGVEYSQDYSTRNTLFTNLGVFENFKPNIIYQKENPILYLGNIHPQLQFEVIDKVKNPYLIAADSMNLWINLFPNEVWKLISKVDILFLNDEEAIQLTGNTDLEKITDEFLNIGPDIVIIKLGSDGSVLATEDKKVYLSVVPNTPIIDPTGAGDSFAAGVLGYIAVNGYNNLVDAVKHGTAIASYTISDFGINGLCKINKKKLNEKIALVKKINSE